MKKLRLPQRLNTSYRKKVTVSLINTRRRRKIVMELRHADPEFRLRGGKEKW
ncbi:MAG: hypothetical protein ACJ70Q_01930 [Nitrososphaera sp.]